MLSILPTSKDAYFDARYKCLLMALLILGFAAFSNIFIIFFLLISGLDPAPQTRYRWRHQSTFCSLCA